MATYIQVHERAIVGFVMPGGGVNDAVNDVARDTARFAREYLLSGGHVRSGTLLRSIQWARAKPTGPYGCSAQVTASARHSVWVHEGTPGMIFPRTGRYLKIPNPKGGGFIYKKAVRGQAPKPYLATGLDLAMAKFRAGA